MKTPQPTLETLTALVHGAVILEGDARAAVMALQFAQLFREYRGEMVRLALKTHGPLSYAALEQGVFIDDLPQLIFLTGKPDYPITELARRAMMYAKSARKSKKAWEWIHTAYALMPALQGSVKEEKWPDFDLIIAAISKLTKRPEIAVSVEDAMRRLKADLIYRDRFMQFAFGKWRVCAAGSAGDPLIETEDLTEALIVLCQAGS